MAGATAAEAPVMTTTSGWRSAVADSPNGVADIVGDDQRAGAVHRHSDRASARLAFAVQEPGDEIHRSANRASSSEADEYDLVAVELGAVPAAVLADERSAAEHRWKA